MHRSTILLLTAAIMVVVANSELVAQSKVGEKAAFEWTEANVGAAFDQLWQSMDRHYSYFTIKTDVDWKKLGDEYRPKAVKAKSPDELMAVLKEMLARLKDGHVWIIKPNGEMVVPHVTTSSLNGNAKVIFAQLTKVTECGQYAYVGKTKADGFGYFIFRRQGAGTPELAAKVIAAIEQLADAPGFVIDLRSATGGNEYLAQDIASVFCEKPVIYAKSRRRSGPKHDEFTPEQNRTLKPAKSGKPFTKPIVCLLGPLCVSSGEGMAKMFAVLPHVTTVGLPTRGSSGNPQPVELGGTGIKVFFSRWVDLMPDGSLVEGKGVQPSVRVEAKPDDYKNGDPTLEKGLEVLREKVNETKKKQGI